MRNILKYFKDFHTAYYNSKLYIQIALFITILITFNYTFDFERSFIDSHFGTLWEIPLFFSYHAIAYFGVLFIIYRFNKKKFTFDKSFWIKSILGLLIIATDRSIFPFIANPIISLVAQPTAVFYHHVLYNAYGWFSVVTIVYITKQFLDKKETFGLYGLRLNNVNIKPYIILLFLVAPIVYFASQMQDFINFYPLYKRTNGWLFAEYYQISEGYAKVIFEFFYLTDFLNTELIFRGFLIIGLSKLIGKDVILPMVACYVVLHFGKPLGETISSAFGGYILGIIALYSRNIWGGVLIHSGTAFLMETFAFMQYS